MYSLVSAIPSVSCVKPEGAFYVFPDFSRVLTDRYPTTADLAEAIIDQTGVALVPGESFGAPGFLRLSYALGEEEIERGVARIADLIDSI